MGHSSRNNLDIDALLKIASMEGDTEIVVSSLDLFLSEYNIDKGDVLVYTKDIYRLYTLWAKEPVNKDKFLESLNDVLGTVSGKRVKLNKDIKDYLPYVKTAKTTKIVEKRKQEFIEWRAKDEKKRRRQLEYKKNTYV